MGKQVAARSKGSQLSWLERTPDKREVGGSSPLDPIKTKYTCPGGIAQLGEHLPCKQGVKGSNPFISTADMVTGNNW